MSDMLFLLFLVKGVLPVKNNKNRVIISTIVILLIVLNINFLIENRHLKENKGDEIGDLMDIVIRVYPEDILDCIILTEDISSDNLELISGEFRTGILFYWLSDGIPEIENYFRYMESQFSEFKKAYEESDSKNITRLKSELVSTCEKGIELYDELERFRDREDVSKEYRMWYKVYNNKNHTIRKLIIEVLGEDRTSYPY